MRKAFTHPLLYHPLSRRIGWVLYAIIFYFSGESFVIWLLEPQNFSGGARWLGVLAFPALFIAFFFIQRHLGCASGHCQLPASDRNQPDSRDNLYRQPPGF